MYRCSPFLLFPCVSFLSQCIDAHYLLTRSPPWQQIAHVIPLLAARSTGRMLYLRNPRVFSLPDINFLLDQRSSIHCLSLWPLGQLGKHFDSSTLLLQVSKHFGSGHCASTSLKLHTGQHQPYCSYLQLQRCR